MKQMGGLGVFATIGKDKRDVTGYVAMSEAEKREIRLVTGHMPFAFMKYVQAPKFCISFVRNPFCRTFSHYTAFKGWEGHYMADHMDFVGVTEYMGESLEALCAMLWRCRIRAT